MSNYTFGTFPTENGINFSVWCPLANEVNVILFEEKEEKKFLLEKKGNKDINTYIFIFFKKY